MHINNIIQQATVGLLQEIPGAENNNIDEDRSQKNSVAQGSIDEGERNTDKIEDLAQKNIENKADKLIEKAYDDVFGGNENTKGRRHGPRR